MATWRTIVSYVGKIHIGNPAACELWFAPHNALTSVYVPFLAGPLASKSPSAIVPEAYSNSSLSTFRRGPHSAWMAARFVFSAAQTSFACAISTIKSAQRELESKSAQLVASAPSAAELLANAENNIEAWWSLSDEILLGGQSCSYGADWLTLSGRCA